MRLGECVGVSTRGICDRATHGGRVGKLEERKEEKQEEKQKWTEPCTSAANSFEFVIYKLIVSTAVAWVRSESSKTTSRSIRGPSHNGPRCCFTSRWCSQAGPWSAGA